MWSGAWDEKGEEEVKRGGDDATEALFTRSRSRVSNFASWFRMSLIGGSGAIE
jgi:hypothetical protein